MGADKGQSCEEVWGQPQEWHKIRRRHETNELFPLWQEQLRDRGESVKGPRNGGATQGAAAGALLPGDLCPQECSKTRMGAGSGMNLTDC